MPRPPPPVLQHDRRTRTPSGQTGRHHRGRHQAIAGNGYLSLVYRFASRRLVSAFTNVQLAAADPPENLFPDMPQQVFRNHNGNTDLTVSFVRRDHSLAGVLLSDEATLEIEPPSGSEGGGYATSIPVPLSGVDVKRKMIIQSWSNEMFTEPGATTCWRFSAGDPIRSTKRLRIHVLCLPFAASHHRRHEFPGCDPSCPAL